jgi:pilus assembly protein Flp/PilA
MEKIFNVMCKFVRDEEGVTIIEYALMAALIALGVVSTVFALQGSLNAMFTKIAACVTAPTTGCGTP